MQYGHEHFFKGIYYNEIKDFVEKEHSRKFTYYSEMAFVKWFLESFSSVNISKGYETTLIESIGLCLQNKHLQYSNDLTGHNKNYVNFNTKFKFFLTGESDRKFLEYQELHEARNNAKQAFVLSILAIGISILSMFFSPILEYYFRLWLISE